jgi:aryl-alcohol dehydrogenase-like predicted oxidoreductase
MESSQEMWKTCQELDVKIVAFGTVGQGMLTDNLTNEKFAKIRLAKMTGWDGWETGKVEAKFGIWLGFFWGILD